MVAHEVDTAFEGHGKHCSVFSVGIEKVVG